MDHAPAVCPACQASCTLHEPVCPACGLVFDTFDSQATRPLNEQPARPGPTSASTSIQAYTPLLPGQTLARQRYTIQQLLSRGGMGTVYLATDHTAFDRTVVIKTMLDYFDPTNPQEAEAARQRFLQEARTLATLRHPAIPQIYSYFQDGPHNYIVMEYIEGRDLEQSLTRLDEDTGNIITGQPYPLEQVVHWGIALCRVLEYLASRQPPVVHHDIKPTNLLLDQNSDEVRLVDFGTARTHLLMTNSGQVGIQKSHIFGTRGYAAPELYRAQSEPRSDIYVLAATLYHLVTDDDPSQHPFDFPHLPKLGAFGDILRTALDSDLTQRPDATTLRQQLEELPVTPVRTTLATPDGADIATVADLIAWCEQHWRQASDWLYDRTHQQNLPDQIEVWWGHTKLAQQLRAIVRGNRNPDVGLDAALARLDPAGYGQATPHLSADTQVVDFGRLTTRTQSCQVTITNTGGRVAQAHLEKPAWLYISSTSISSRTLAKNYTLILTLAPGQSASVLLVADIKNFRFGGTINDSIAFRQDDSFRLQIDVHTEVQPWRVLRKHLAHRTVILAVLCLFLFGIIVYTIINRYEPEHLAQPHEPEHPAQLHEPEYMSRAPKPAHLAESQPVATAGPIPTTPPHLKDNVFTTHAGAVASLAFSPDGQTLASGHEDNVIKLWQINDTNLKRIFTQRTTLTDNLAFGPDGQTLVAHDATTLTIWQIKTDSLQQIFTQDSNSIQDIALSPDGHTIATVGAEINVWQVDTGELLWSSASSPWQVYDVAFSADSTMLATTTRDDRIHKLHLWRTEDGWPLRVLNERYLSPEDYSEPSGPVIPTPTYPGLSHVNAEILTMITSTGLVKYWYPEKNWSYQTINDPKLDYIYLAVSPDNSLLAAGDYNLIDIWDVTKKERIQTIHKIYSDIRSLAFSPDGQTLTVGDAAGNIMLWPVQP